jgi:hypothetical protein
LSTLGARAIQRPDEFRATTCHVNETQRHDKFGIDLLPAGARQRSHAGTAEILSVAYSDHIGASGLQSIDNGSLFPREPEQDVHRS